jgi:hypothetical protein
MNSMSSMKSGWKTAALAAALCAATGALAATAADLPPAQTSGQVTYLSGGVGKDQQAAIKHEASNYPLEMKFLRTGKGPAEYLTAIPVTIKDQTGKVVLDTRSDGPLMLAKLPDGKYTITAEEAGKSELRHVTVAQGKHRTVVFRWAA